MVVAKIYVSKGGERRNNDDVASWQVHGWQAWHMHLLSDNLDDRVTAVGCCDNMTM
jgi:hypothetical protein